jgi:hypothetical protein
MAGVEAALTPTQLVLRWLEEAHAHGSVDAYVSAILADDPEAFPLDRLCREAAAGARAALRSRAREQVDAAVRKALRETVFRFELVMCINVIAHEVLDKELLLHALFAAYLAMLGSEDPGLRHGEGHRARLALTRDLLLGRVTELEVIAEARRLAEDRYLDGRPALFPDAVRTWGTQLGATRELAAMAIRLAELDGVPLPDSEDEDSISARVATRLADLVEPAKSTALEKLGEGGRAMRVVSNWLRPKLVAPPSPPPPSFTSSLSPFDKVVRSPLETDPDRVVCRVSCHHPERSRSVIPGASEFGSAKMGGCSRY